MRFRSPKREVEYRKRRVLVASLLSERPVCERCGEARSVDIHEIVRRSQANVLLDESVMKAVCRACHTWIGENPNAAEAEGFYMRGSTFRMRGANG